MKRIATGCVLTITGGVSLGQALVVESVDLSETDRASLIIEAAPRLSLRSTVLHVFSFERSGVHADVLFGPYDWSDSTFSLDRVRCSRTSPRKWKCERAETLSFMHSGTLSSGIRLGQGVRLELARAIAGYSDPSCALNEVSIDGPEGPRAILSAPYIHRDPRTGNYWRYAQYCSLEMGVADGKVQWSKRYDVLE